MSESEKKTPLEIDGVPVDGNLGLLAAGYRGIMLWREARQKAGIDVIADRKEEHERLKKEMEERKAAFEEKKKEAEAKRKKDKE